MTGSSIFLAQTWRHINTLSSFTTKIRQHWVVWFCWLLLTSPLVIHTSNLDPWWSCVWLNSSVVLDEDFCCLLTIILAGPEPCMAHSLVYFTPLPSSDILKVTSFPCLPSGLPPPTHCWAAWYYHPSANPCEKNSKMAKTLLLGTWIGDGFKALTSATFKDNLFLFYVRIFAANYIIDLCV